MCDASMFGSSLVGECYVRSRIVLVSVRIVRDCVAGLATPPRSRAAAAVSSRWASLKMPRRAALDVLSAAAIVRWPAWPAAAAELSASPEPLSSRLDATRLTPLLSTERSMPGDLRYPTWLAGTWRVTTKGAGFAMPLGPRFVEPELVAEARKPVRLAYGARFLESQPPPAGSPSLSVQQDRRFNAIQEEGAFVQPPQSALFFLAV